MTNWNVIETSSFTFIQSFICIYSRTTWREKLFTILCYSHLEWNTSVTVSVLSFVLVKPSLFNYSWLSACMVHWEMQLYFRLLRMAHLLYIPKSPVTSSELNQLFYPLTIFFVFKVIDTLTVHLCCSASVTLLSCRHTSRRGCRWVSLGSAM